MRERAYFTYIVASRSHVLYVGMTGDFQGRVWKHKWKEYEGCLSRYNCDRLVWFERFQDVLSHVPTSGTWGTHGFCLAGIPEKRATRPREAWKGNAGASNAIYL
jgi:GIY-YIG catalytic domain